MIHTKCTRCGGTGKVEGPCSSIISVWQTLLLDDDCPVCGGSGEMPVKENRSLDRVAKSLENVSKTSKPETRCGIIYAMQTKQPPKKRYWPDGAAIHAKCPKCGQYGRRTMSANGQCWTFNHGAVTGILGLPEGRYCFVPVAEEAK